MFLAIVSIKPFGVVGFIGEVKDSLTFRAGSGHVHVSELSLR